MTEFETIYRRYFTDVELYLRAVTKDDSLAEELTEQVFFQALKALPKFRGDCDVRVWLCQIAKNSYYTYVEKNKRTESLDGRSAEAADGKSLTDSIEDKEAAKLIQSVLHSIEDPYKEVFMWRVYADMSFKEIGRIFSKSENWACVTYHRAKKMIKQRLEEYGYEN